MNDTAIAPSTERQAFYDRIGEHSLAPLWERLHSMVTRAPVTPALPTLWDYDAVVRPFLMQAGDLITAKEAERRVLILENPGLRGQTLHHPLAVRRPATDHAGRSRAGASAFAIGACASSSKATAPTPRSKANAR